MPKLRSVETDPEHQMGCTQLLILPVLCRSQEASFFRLVNKWAQIEQAMCVCFVARAWMNYLSKLEGRGGRLDVVKGYGDPEHGAGNQGLFVLGALWRSVEKLSGDLGLEVSSRSYSTPAPWTRMARPYALASRVATRHASRS